MPMGRCAICGTKITTLHKNWVHLINGNDDHQPTPEPKNKKRGGS